MKMNIFLTAVVFIMLASCRKEKSDDPVSPGPDMDYIDLSGQEVGFNQYVTIDLNNDNRKDIGFSTLLVGDPLAKQDKLQYTVYSDIYTSLPVDGDENSPVQNKNDLIPVENFGNYNWYNASYIVLAQKTVPQAGGPFWTGKWKDVSHKYLPVQVTVDDKRYNGWVELSFDSTTQKTILHRAAISRKAEREIKAGV